MRVHPVFHVNLLRPANNDPLPEQRQPPPPPVEVDGAEEFEVERIVDEETRIVKGKRVKFYKVRWAGYGTEEDSWLPFYQLNNAPEVVRQWRNNQ